jgi:hypothetical protein
MYRTYCTVPVGPTVLQLDKNYILRFCTRATRMEQEHAQTTPNRLTLVCVAALVYLRYLRELFSFSNITDKKLQVGVGYSSVSNGSKQADRPDW